MKIRNSNFELLRILSMFMIIAHHYSVHGHFEFTYGIHLNNMFLDFLYLGGQIGVVLFVFISGYHMIHSELSLKKVIRLELQILFYSVLIGLLFYFFPSKSLGSLSISQLSQAFLPVTHSFYWFATTYMILYLLTPYINKMLLHLEQSEFIKLLILGLLFCILVPSFAYTDLGVGRVIYFIFFYSIGAYFRLYPVQIKKRKLLLASSISYFLLFLTTVFFQFLSSYDANYSVWIYHFAGINSLFVLFISISIFLLFQNWKVQYHKWINVVASTTFGIYLIHDNPFFKQFLWVDFFQNSTYYMRKALFPHAILSIAVVFISCAIIELFRIYLLEKMLSFWKQKRNLKG